MVPLYILVVATLLLRGVGLVVEQLSSWRTCTRLALAILFAVAGATHFTEMKHDFARMVPPALPYPMAIVYVSGVFELLGAIGLLTSRWRRPAGLGLFVLLLAVFPANVHAALEGVPFGDKPPTPLWLRAIVQVVLLAAVGFVIGRGPRRESTDSSAR